MILNHRDINFSEFLILKNKLLKNKKFRAVYWQNDIYFFMNDFFNIVLSPSGVVISKITGGNNE